MVKWVNLRYKSLINALQQFQNPQELQQSALISCSCSRLAVKHLCSKSRSPLHIFHPRTHSEGKKWLSGATLLTEIVQEYWRKFAIPLKAHFRNGLLLLPSQFSPSTSYNQVQSQAVGIFISRGKLGEYL